MNLLILLFIPFFQSNTYQYASSQIYVPINKNKNEFIINFSNRNIHLGYSLTNHYSIFIKGNKIKHVTNNLYYIRSEEEYSGDNCKEISLGNSIFFNKNNFTYEILFGAGKGNFFYVNYFFNYDYSLNADKFSYFLQPDLGFILNKNFEIDLFSNFSFVRYYNIFIRGYNKRGDRVRVPQDDYFLNKSHVYFNFLNPGLLFRYGYKHIKGQISISKTYMLGRQKNIFYKKDNISLSIFIDLDILNKKEKKTESNL